MERKNEKKKRSFCKAFLRTMDPERAASAAGCTDGYGMLTDPEVTGELERMREALAGQLTGEDPVRRLCELAFGRANDAVKLAFLSQEELEKALEGLDLSALAEFKKNGNGTMEVKLVDRVKALEGLAALLGGQRDAGGADAFYRALEQRADGGEE